QSEACWKRQSLLRLEKRHRLDAIAVGIADEGGVVAFAVLRSQPRRAVGTAAGRERRGMERIDQFHRAHAQPHMDAAVTVNWGHSRAQVEPKFGIGLAKADGTRPNN